MELTSPTSRTALGCEEWISVSLRVRAACDRYIGHWVQKLKEDKREIFRAAADAQKSRTWLWAFIRRGRGGSRLWSSALFL